MQYYYSKQRCTHERVRSPSPCTILRAALRAAKGRWSLRPVGGAAEYDGDGSSLAKRGYGTRYEEETGIVSPDSVSRLPPSAAVIATSSSPLSPITLGVSKKSPQKMTKRRLFV